MKDAIHNRLQGEHSGVMIPSFLGLCFSRSVVPWPTTISGVFKGRMEKVLPFPLAPFLERKWGPFSPIQTGNLKGIFFVSPQLIISLPCFSSSPPHSLLSAPFQAQISHAHSNCWALHSRLSCLSLSPSQYSACRYQQKHRLEEQLRMYYANNFVQWLLVKGGPHCCRKHIRLQLSVPRTLTGTLNTWDRFVKPRNCNLMDCMFRIKAVGHCIISLAHRLVLAAVNELATIKHFSQLEEGKWF